MELDAEVEKQLGVHGIDVDAVANGTKDTSRDLDGLGDDGKVLKAELPDGMVRVRFDHDGELHLSLELIELRSVL